MWNALEKSTNNSELTSSQVVGVNLNSLRAKLIAQLNEFLANEAVDSKALASFAEDTRSLEAVIPHLNGNEQVFYAKLYRICSLVSESS